MRRENKATILAVAVTAAGIAVLCGPVATWLQLRDLRPDEKTAPDAIYVLAGERDRNRRARAAVEYIAGLASQEAGGGSEALRPVRVLVGNDPTPGCWSSRDGRNLTLGEWAAREISDKMAEKSRTRFQCEVVPGRFRGTDGEMAALARYLRAVPEVRTIVLITSPFHMRRSVWRLTRHADSGLTISALDAAQNWRDRMPWTVLGELAKMVRDASGLAQAPLVTRAGWPAGMHSSDLVLMALVLVTAYAWLLYPLLLDLAVRIRRPRPHTGSGPLPRSMAILFAAHNEEDVIEQRLDNLVETCRPTATFPLSARGGSAFGGTPCPLPLASIHLGLDGCTDRTAEIARECAKNNPAIHIHEFADRRGKTAVLKDLVRAVGNNSLRAFPVAGDGEGRAALQSCSSQVGRPALLHPESQSRRPDMPAGGVSPAVDEAGPEIFVFTDANTVFHPDALGKLLAHFADSAVGGVCGRLALVSKGASSEGTYWNWESGLKEKESLVDSCLGANGAIYAIRSGLFWSDMPDNTVIDDFVAGMKVREQGYKMVFEQNAFAEEELPAHAHEWKRRVRIGAGDFQALTLCRKCLSPRYGRFAWMFWSHKVLRWFTPHMLLVILAIALWHVLKPRPSWFEGAPWLHVRQALDSAIIAAVGILLLCAAIGRLGGGSERKWLRMCALSNHFVTMQAALFMGFLSYCRGGLPGYWTRTPRGGGGVNGE